MYWPVDLLRCQHARALVLGIPVKESSLVVVNVVGYDSLDELVSSKVIRKSGKGYALLCDSDAKIVGYVGDDVPGMSLRSFTLNPTVQCCGAMVILFDPPMPNSMHFYTVSPIEIFWSHDTKSTGRYVELIKEHSQNRELKPQERDFATSMEVLNKCWVERNVLMISSPQMSQSWDTNSFWRKLGRAISYRLAVVYATATAALRPVSSFFIYIVILLRHVCIHVIHILNHKATARSPSLVEISATAQQIDLRLQEFCYFPIQYIRTSREIKSNGATSLPKEQYPEYIRFYNTLWLVVNDITLGFVLNSFLKDNERVLADFFDRYIVSKLLYSDLNNILIWLMSSPGGIKLNNGLSVFLSDLFRWVIEFWKMTLIDNISPHYGLVVRCIAVSCMFGATFGIALCADFVSVVTFHIYCFYLAGAKIYHGQLSVIRSLFRLFCGQKRNILRNRIDSNNYELDQLLLGTLLFTVLSFLLPTVVIFYITFTVTALLILVISASLIIVMSLLNHFPLFILLLRFKDSKRVPGGVQSWTQRGYIRLDIKPILIADMFAPFNNVLHRLNESYFSGAVLVGILTGVTVNVQRSKLYKILYSALPAKRMPTKLLLQEIAKSRVQRE